MSRIGKLLESLIRDKLIDDGKRGFRQKKSCLTSLLEYLECVTSETDAGLL